MKRVKLALSGKIFELPKLVRSQHMCLTYQMYQKDRSPVKKLGRSSFLNLLSLATSGNEKVVSAIDYVTGCLVNDTTETLQRIIKDFCVDTAEKNRFSDLLELSRFWIKCQYDTHAQINGDCVHTHGITFALTLEGKTDSSCAIADKCDCCTDCSFIVYFLMDVLPKAVNDSRAVEKAAQEGDALRYISDTLEKFERFRGHRVRVKNQQHALRQAEQAMKQQCIDRKEEVATTCLAVIDFAMKFDPIMAREKTPEHFGKRGISWHINQLHFYQWNPEEEVAVRFTVTVDQLR